MKKLAVVFLLVCIIGLIGCHGQAAEPVNTIDGNLKVITFEQAWKAAGLSSHLSDYFAAEEAVLVEMH